MGGAGGLQFGKLLPGFFDLILQEPGLRKVIPAFSLQRLHLRGRHLFLALVGIVALLQNGRYHFLDFFFDHLLLRSFRLRLDRSATFHLDVPALEALGRIQTDPGVITAELGSQHDGHFRLSFARQLLLGPVIGLIPGIGMALCQANQSLFREFQFDRDQSPVRPLRPHPRGFEEQASFRDFGRH